MFVVPEAIMLLSSARLRRIVQPFLLPELTIFVEMIARVVVERLTSGRMATMCLSLSCT